CSAAKVSKPVSGCLKIAMFGPCIVMRVRARGITTLAVAPYLSMSCAIPIVNAVIPAFAAAEFGWPWLPKRKASEAVETSRPYTEPPVALARSRQWMQANFEGAKCPFRCTRTTESNSSSPMLKIVASRVKPALLTRTWRSPKPSTAVRISSSAVFQSATSPKCGSARPPRSGIPAPPPRPFDSSRPAPSTPAPRSFPTTDAPSRASSSACRRPSPVPAPVTTATFPSSSLAIAGLREPLEDRGGADRGTAAHRHERQRPLAALELVQRGGEQPGAGRAGRVAGRGRAAARVHALHVGLDDPRPREHHRREGLVDLDHVEVRDLHAGLAQDLAGRVDRPVEQVVRVGADDDALHDARARAQ